tara:strand:- start:126 stop:632 length:507 start_codon:yes stop_codon:yes gene_type:complete
MTTRKAVRRGFTLIEVLIVLAIVLALSAIVGVALFQRQDDAQLQLAQTDMNTIERGMKMFRLDMGRFPTEEEGVAVLWDSELLDADAEETTWKGPYLEEPIPTDRWKNEWGYRAESEYGRDYDLWSFGPDGEEDTEDDITSWSSGDAEGEFGDGGLEPLPEPGGSSAP